MSMAVPDDAPKPRLAHVKKRSDFNGYGFNLHAEKGKAGQYIGKVDPGSPAEKAGLKEGDRIVEVNGTNIGNENHQQVVQRVKAVPDETKLLVVDAETDKYYKEHKIVVRGDMPNVDNFSSDSSSTQVVSNGSETPPKTQRADSLPGDAPSPRCCHLKIWPDFQGYGFNLHAEKGKPGQFIGKVDDGSPAEAAGLREGDRIIEINDENIGQDTHKQVVSKIKAKASETKLLVVDPEAEKYYKERGTVVSHTMSNVVFITCPDSKPAEDPNGNAVEAEVVNHVTAPAQEEADEIRDSYVTEEAERDADDKEKEGQEEEEEKKEEEERSDPLEESAVMAAVVAGSPQPDDMTAVTSAPEEDPPQKADSDGEAAAAAISESIREVEQAVESDPEDEKAEQNNNFDLAEDYDVIANVPKQDSDDEPSREPEVEPQAEPPREEEREPEEEAAPPHYDEAAELASVPAPQVQREEPKAAEPVPEPQSPSKGPVTVGGIEFAGSAKEARQRMSKKRRDEVKSQNLSAKDKYDMYMRM